MTIPQFTVHTVGTSSPPPPPCGGELCGWVELELVHDDDCDYEKVI